MMKFRLLSALGFPTLKQTQHTRSVQSNLFNSNDDNNKIRQRFNTGDRRLTNFRTRGHEVEAPPCECDVVNPPGDTGLLTLV